MNQRLTQNEHHHNQMTYFCDKQALKCGLRSARSTVIFSVRFHAFLVNDCKYVELFARHQNLVCNSTYVNLCYNNPDTTAKVGKIKQKRFFGVIFVSS